MPSGTLRRIALVIAIACAAAVAGCGGGFLRQQYEYEEELYLQLDGSATAYLNASIASLVALRGADLNADPRSRPDREKLRTLFAAPGVRMSTPTFSRREGRRFVHLRFDVPDVRQLPRIAPFAWSTYRFERKGDVFTYLQVVGKSAGRPVPVAGWRGGEMVSFKMHLPSRIPSNNSPKPVQRGNILQWEQPLSDRMASVPLEIEAQLQPQSILSSTLLLFAGTIVAAALTFAVVIWWVVRRGRSEEAPSST
jgi:hypothetical protein